MAITRREALATLGGASFAAANAVAQQKPKSNPRPALCAYSGNLAQVPYQELSGFVKQLGYDGVDLTVMKGGHIDPALYMVDLDRAFQTVQGDGLELPMVTTSFTSPSEPYAYAILYVSGQLGAKFCRLGTWPQASPSPDPMRATMMRNDLVQFAVTAARCKITPLMANHAGSYPGRSLPEAEAMLNGVPPTGFGYCFDPAQAVIEARSADGWEAALTASLPRLGAVSVSDVALEKETGKATPCALGEGVIDWKKFFTALAAARFRGPVSLQTNYGSPTNVNGMTKDLAYARARVEEAWPL